VYVFGANADQTALAADRVLGSAVIDIPRAFLLVASEVRSGHFAARTRVFGLRDSVVVYRSNPLLDSLIPARLRSRMKAAADSLIAGTLIAAPRPRSMEG
jgi:basic membrane lipoprotein Med (substrate-binding protein (PBP1-ABC) superfamily)